MDYNKSLNDIYRGDDAVGSRAGAMDQNAFFNRVYGWMFGALALTAGVAYFIAGRPELVKMIFGKPILFWGIVIAQFLLVIGISAAINRISVGAAVLGFAAYSALNGVIFSTLFLVYTAGSLALTFGATGLTFGAMSLIGYLTRRDLSGMGGILTMGLIGFVIGTVINMFWANGTLYWLMTYLGLAVFIGLTAYDTNKLRQIANSPELTGGAMGRKLALLGALTLYLDFINLFLLLLRIFGGRRD